MDAPTLLATGLATAVVLIALLVVRRRAPMVDKEDDEGPQAVLRLGNEHHVMPGSLSLHEDVEGTVVLTHPAGYRADRDGRSDVARFALQGAEYALVGELEAVSLELQAGAPSVLHGLQGQFVTPPDGQVVRERSVFVGTEDPELGEAILDAFTRNDEPKADASIPWTLEGATRYAAKYLINRSIVLSAEVESPGELLLRFPDGEDGRIHLGNLFLNQMQDARPTEALDALQHFLGSVTPNEAALEREQLLPRIHRGTPPILITGTSPTGQEVQHELASHQIGDDLSVIYVQDLPDRMRYLSPADADALEPDDDRRITLARANLARSMRRIRILGDGPVFMVVCGGTYEASLIQLPELWAVLDPLLDGPRMVAVPARDLLFITGDAGQERRRQLLALARPQAELAYPISDGVYRWHDHDDSWERLAL